MTPGSPTTVTPMNSFPLVAFAAPCSNTPIRLGIAAALLAVVAPAQAWLRAQPPVHPVSLRGHCMVFDAARDTTVLFSGLTVGMPSDTWTWNGSNWALRQPIAAPSGRLDSAMVYDSARQRVVLHGGMGHNAEYLSDTWEWDGFNWLQISPLHTLGPRCSFAMAYDQARAQTVLFGGRANTGYPGGILGDTWTWDGTDWTQLAPAHSPEAREEAQMVYDQARARCVLFGGWGNHGPVQTLGDTWTWDGVDWTQQVIASSPSPRSEHALTYNTANQHVVLFGGRNVTYQPLDETWEYDGSEWVQQTVSVSPSPRFGTAMAYDETRAMVVLFAGEGWLNPEGDTWLFESVTNSAFQPFGQGCFGSVGMPQLALAGGSPILGTTVQVACTHLQLDHFATMWLGFSRTAWTFGSLPFDLRQIGMPGCTLFVSGDLVTPLLNWNGTAFWQMTIPNAPHLVGLPFYLQAGVIDRVNPLGMVVTNAAAVRISDH